MEQYSIFTDKIVVGAFKCDIVILPSQDEEYENAVRLIKESKNLKMLADLEKFILLNYRSKHGSLTPLHSEGNYDDVFDDGYKSGVATTLYDIAKIIGIQVREIESPETERNNL